MKLPGAVLPAAEVTGRLMPGPDLEGCAWW